MEEHSYQLIDGKAVAEQIKKELAAEVEKIKQDGRKAPHLVAILVGHDGGSEAYVANKVRNCEEIGLRSSLIRFEDDVTEQALLDKVNELNADDDVDGLIVQMPLPKRISSQRVIEAIDYRKDVDGFHPVNVGHLVLGAPGLRPCTPAGCIRMLDYAGISIEGAHAVIIGRSNIVGKPMAHLLLERNATVTICHSRTQNLAAIARTADILVAAVGRPHFVTADMVKEGATVIDVGINRIAPKKLVGDVDFDAAAAVAGAITPVPGGVGLLTVAMLMENVVQAAKAQNA